MRRLFGYPPLRLRSRWIAPPLRPPKVRPAIRRTAPDPAIPRRHRGNFSAEPNRCRDGAPLGGSTRGSVPSSAPPSIAIEEKRGKKEVALATETAALAARADAEARKAQADAIASLSPQNSPLDARALFYLNQPVPVTNAFVESARGGGGGARPAPSARLAGALTGHVIDPSGASILNATVTVTDPAKQITFIAEDQRWRRFLRRRIAPRRLFPGSRGPGFQETLSRRAHPQPERPTLVGNLVMEVGALTETVEVTASNPAVQTAPRADTRMNSVTLLRSAAAPAPATPRLGVRVSILRGDREVDVGTVLDSGEKVRLKLIPNNDGFLSVTEGTRTIASGTAQRLKPFETPELRFEGAGRRQLVVTLSRTPIASNPLRLAPSPKATSWNPPPTRVVLLTSWPAHAKPLPAAS